MRLLLIALALVGGATAYNQLCTPGTYFRSDCNTCACTYEGRAVCTKKACHPGYYKPGSSFKDPLNDVHHVIPGISNVEVSQAQQIGESHDAAFEVCTPNSFFNIGCNQCRCSILGDTYTCTRYLCGSTQQYPQQNVPNYPNINYPNQYYPQQNVPNYPTQNQQYPQQNVPSYPTQNQPNQQNVPNYPVPNVPNQPPAPLPDVPNQQHSTENPEQPHKHSHKCGHHHKKAAKQV